VPDLHPRIRVLIITAGRYDDDRLARLAGPRHDSINLTDALETHGDAEVLALPEHSTEDAKKELERFLGTFDDTETAVVYFSGHAIRRDDRLFLATRTTDLELLETTAIEAAWVRRLLDGCGARAKVWILDCCHAAAGARAPGLFKGLADLPTLTADTPQFKGDNTPDVRQGRGLAVLAASSADQKALDGHEGSAYTNVLIEGINTGEADLDGDGWVSAEELAHHANDVLGRRVPGMETRHFVDDMAGRILLTRAAGRRVRVQPHQPASTVWWRDLGGPVVLAVTALLVGGGIWLTRHNAVGAVIAGLVVGVLACLGYLLALWSTARN
jgi:hypothetical protein